MKTRLALLASGWGVAALIVFAPGADSAQDPELKLTTALKGVESPNDLADSVYAKCPQGYEVLGGGYFVSGNYTVDTEGKVGGRRYFVHVIDADGVTRRRGSSALTAQAICAKGTGGLKIDDDGTGLP